MHKENLLVRVPAEIVDKLDTIAILAGVSRNKVVKVLLAVYLASHKEADNEG